MTASTDFWNDDGAHPQICARVNTFLSRGDRGNSKIILWREVKPCINCAGAHPSIDRASASMVKARALRRL